jgi:hypothetical protein
MKGFSGECFVGEMRHGDRKRGIYKEFWFRQWQGFVHNFCKRLSMLKTSSMLIDTESR